MIFQRLLLPTLFGLLTPFVFVAAVSAVVKHTVSPGDTLSYIALIYEKTVDEIASHNGLVNPDSIYPGQELDIPGDGGGAYVVQPGDTLSGVAWQHGVTTDALQAANGISDADYIYVGQLLTIPGPYSAPATPELLFPDRPWAPSLEAMIDDIASMEGVDAGLGRRQAVVVGGDRVVVVPTRGVEEDAQIARAEADVVPGALPLVEVEPEDFPLKPPDGAGHDLHDADRSGAADRPLVPAALDGCDGLDEASVDAFKRGDVVDHRLKAGIPGPVRKGERWRRGF